MSISRLKTWPKSVRPEDVAPAATPTDTNTTPPPAAATPRNPSSKGEPKRTK